MTKMTPLTEIPDTQNNLLPFLGMNVSADGKQIVNQPDELKDFCIAKDCFLLNAADLGINRQLTFISGTATELTASSVKDANVVVIQGIFTSASAAASAIAQTGSAHGPGAFIYFNENLQINRLVYASDLGNQDTELSTLANIRSLTGEAALNALPTFSVNNFTLIKQQITGEQNPNFNTPYQGNHLVNRNDGPKLITGHPWHDGIFGNKDHEASLADWRMTFSSATAAIVCLWVA